MMSSLCRVMDEQSSCENSKYLGLGSMKVVVKIWL